MSEVTMALKGRLASSSARGLVGVLAIAGGAVFVGVLTADPRGLRVAVASAAVVLFVAVGFHRPQYLLYSLVGWLGILGLVRRLATEIGAPWGSDPLLLVGPLSVVALFAASTVRRPVLSGSALTKAAAVLAGLILLGALNPLQGGLATGAAGLLFLLVPVLGFWVGRELCDDATLTVVFKMVAALAVPAAVYGLVQTLGSFPSWDAHWITSAVPGYNALSVNGTIRPFSTFSAASEFASYLAVATVVWLVFARRGHRIVGLAAIALLVTTLVYESSRGIIVALVVALALMFAAHRGWTWSGAAAAGLVAIVLLPVAVGRFAPSAPDRTGQATLVSRQVSGLAKPFDPKSSTLLVHLSLIGEGLRSGVTHPVGLGTGSVTIAGQKFGAGTKNSEADPSNAATALGVPGFVAYLTVLVLGLSRAYAVARRRRDPLALVALGLLVVMLFQWLNGGQYAVALLPWLVLGWLERGKLSNTGRRFE
jgi:hypothetical protein